MSRALTICALWVAASMLAACTTAEVLEPSAMTGTSPATADPAALPDAAAPEGTPPAPTPSPSAPATAAAVASLPSTTRARINFAPIVGATVEAAGPLSERLALKARERGITLARSGEPGTTHVLKGYFSAITEGKKTTVIYVWDVLDPSGNRLHRIQGQKAVAAGNATGWASVPSGTMLEIADGTVDELVAWLGARAG
jgi:hypothetical protein